MPESQKRQISSDLGKKKFYQRQNDVFPGTLCSLYVKLVSGFMATIQHKHSGYFFPICSFCPIPIAV